MTDQSKKEKEVVDENGDYIWRFKLSPEVDKAQAEEEDAFVDLFRRQLQDLLKIIVLTKDGKRVRIDGFRLINNVEKEFKIFENKRSNR